VNLITLDLLREHNLNLKPGPLALIIKVHIVLLSTAQRYIHLLMTQSSLQAGWISFSIIPLRSRLVHIPPFLATASFCGRGCIQDRRTHRIELGNLPTGSLYVYLVRNPRKCLIVRLYLQTEDYLWAIVLLTAPAQIRLTCGLSASTQMLPAGLNKLGLLLSGDCTVKAEIWRAGTLGLQFIPSGFAFRKNPSSYNFNAFVAASS
jgi:hypothetical protein